MRCEGKRTEYLCKSGVADIEPASVSSEGRHHQARFIANETTPCQGAPASANACHRMQMAGDFAGVRLRRRLVTKQQRPKRHRSGKNAANAVGGIGVMVAGNPDPVATALQREQFGAVGSRKAHRSVLIVK